MGFVVSDRALKHIESFQIGLSNQIASSLTVGGVAPEIKMIEMDDLANNILSGATQYAGRGKLSRSKILSTCLEISNVPGDLVLAINRIVDHNGDSYQSAFGSLGPRPGHHSISTQIDIIRGIAKGQPLVLVEDGAFTGGTLSNVIQMLENARVHVEAVFVGFSFPGAVVRLKKAYKGKVVEILVDLHDPIDWMPDHDFFPLVPNCGKVVGVKIGEVFYPYYNSDGASFSIPYVEPFATNMSGWTNIPKTNTKEVSRFCLAAAKEFFSILESDNRGADLSVRRLVTESKPRISVPHYAGSTESSLDSDSAYDFLRKAENKAWS